MKLHQAAVAALLLGPLAACDSKPPEPKLTLHEVMAGTIDPAADVVWGETNKAYGDDGKAAPGKLTEAEWLKTEQFARKIHDGAMIIAENPDIAATLPGVKILDEGKEPEAVTAAQVAGYIARDRPGLSRHARELSELALGIEAAAKARDAIKTVQLAEQLDEVCESCHKQFWYPDQPALVGKR